MWKTLRILCLILVFLISACTKQSEVTVVTTTTTLPPTTTTTESTTTTLPPTTTTSKPSTYRAASLRTQDGIWDALAQCESGGDWGKRGGRYDGGLQFHPNTWTSYVSAGKSYELVGYPAHAYDASREQQITVATRVRDGVPGSSAPYLNPQGYGAWSKCRRIVGI